MVGYPDSFLGVQEWTTEEILALLKQANAFAEDSAVIPLMSRKGTSIREGINRTILQLVRKKVREQISARGRASTSALVLRRYTSVYAIAPEDLAESTGSLKQRKSFFRINGEVAVEMRPDIVRMLAVRKIGDVIATIAPESVCEVGCGHGMVLFYLANRFRDIRFHGFELTASGVALAEKLKRLPLHETRFGEILGINEDSLDSIRKVTVQAGSAFGLPCDDQSFDVVYTANAVEQMSHRLPEALREIRRVARRYVVFHEPFRDVNDGYGKLYLWSVNYFRSPVRYLERFGLRPVALFRAFPVKSSFAYGLVIAEVA